MVEPYYDKDGITIHCGDNCDVLGTFPRDCVDLVVTSPPYDDLRTYGGHEWDFYGVAWQLKRVLKPGGVIVWVVNDQTKNGSETGSSMMQAMHFQAVGLNLHDTMIYKKSAVGACGSNDAYWQEWEYVFVLSLGRPNAVNRIADRKNSTAGTKRTFNKKCDQVGTRQNRETVVSETGVRGNVWEYHTGMFNGGDKTNHPAMFPEKLARDHITSWSNEGDTILDPFNGSGTTTKMARKLGRKGIGIEINEEYCEIAVKRLEQRLLNFQEGA